MFSFRAPFAAIAAVAVAMATACLLPEVESSGGESTQPADSLGTSASTAPAEALPPADVATPSDEGPSVSVQARDASQTQAANGSSGDASVGETAPVDMQQDAGSTSGGMVAADSGTRAPVSADCRCKETNECCDGCQPLNEGGACKPDGYGCTLEVCRMGACVHEDRKDRCFADGLCHQAGDPHLTNKCLVCDPSRNYRGWTPRDFGTACGSGVCRREDYCGGAPQAGVCVSVDTCAGTGLTCDYLGMCTEPN